jgi:hypothetical protein
LVTTCSHRGCGVPAAKCDIDHRNEWVRDRGSTDQANASPACGPHDRWKHANQIRSRRSTNGRTYLIKPDGTTILPVGAREPEWAEPPPPEPPINDDPPPESDPWAGFDQTLTLDDMTVTVIRPEHPIIYHLVDGELRRRL